MEYSWQEIDAEVKRLGLVPAKDSDFTPEQVTAEIESWNYPERHLVVCKLEGNDHSPDVLTAFANLARKMGRGHDINNGVYGGLTIVRQATQFELDIKALNKLKSKAYYSKRDVAKASLEERAAKTADQRAAALAIAHANQQKRDAATEAGL